MTLLDILLIVKILVTGVMVVMPLLFIPQVSLEKRLGIGTGSMPYIRLYGVAVLALLFGYGSALSGFTGGPFPWGIIIMGLVSNGGASAVMIVSGLAAKQKILLGFFITITVLLLLSAIFPDLAMQQL